jgi:hypothetical protein
MSASYSIDDIAKMPNPEVVAADGAHTRPGAPALRLDELTVDGGGVGAPGRVGLRQGSPRTCVPWKTSPLDARNRAGQLFDDARSDKGSNAQVAVDADPVVRPRSRDRVVREYGPPLRVHARTRLGMPGLPAASTTDEQLSAAWSIDIAQTTPRAAL